MIFRSSFSIRTEKGIKPYDITDSVSSIIKNSPFKEGIVNIYVTATTAALFINENDQSLITDIKELMSELVPREKSWKHNLNWGEGNAHSHLRAILTGPSLTIPMSGGRLILGTWQKIFLVEYDVSPRDREIVVSVVGG